MPTGSFINNITVAGLNIRSSKTKTATGEIGVEKTLAAAEAGTLTTRASNTAGTLTMTNTSHGILTAATIDSTGQMGSATRLRWEQWPAQPFHLL